MTPTDLLHPQPTEPTRPEVEDAVIEEARRRARRRRRTYAGIVAAAVVAATALATLDRTPPTDGTTAAGTSDTASGAGPTDTPRGSQWTGVPWCVPDPVDPDRAERIVGAGPPVKAWCSYNPRGSDGSRPFNERRERWLISHAGSTILLGNWDDRRGARVYRVADGKLTHLGSGRFVMLNHDGSYLAASNGQCGETLSIYRVATAEKVAQTAVPGLASGCARLAGFDDQGRVYVDDDSGYPDQPLDLQMYDVRNDRWHPVTDLPRIVNRGPTNISYVTANGLAVTVDERRYHADGDDWTLPVSSIEGVVDAAGRFTQRRWVPIGRGSWSPDRSLVADQRLDGVVVRRATDLTTQVRLDLPADQYGGPEGAAVPMMNGIEWVSDHTVLVTSLSDSSVYRCEARTGTCTHLHRPGVPAFGASGPRGG